MQNHTYLLTEWEGRTGKYLAQGHGVWTERSEVGAPRSRAKASFIYISSNASFTPTLISWSWKLCTFWDSSVVSLKSSPWVKYTQYGTVFQKKFMFYYQTFFFLQICSLLDCSSQIPEKKIGGHHARLREKEHLFRYRV